MSTHDSHGDHEHDVRTVPPPGPTGPTVDWATVGNVALLLAILLAVAAMLTMISSADVHPREASDSGGGPKLAPVGAEDVERRGARAVAADFLERFERGYRHYSTLANEAEWLSNTRIVEGDDTNAKRTDAAKKALAEGNGAIAVIESCSFLLARKAELEPLQVRQLEAILYLAADKPATAKELVEQRIAAETRQVEKLFGYTFRLDGQEVTTNDLDEILKKETDLERRRRAWEASKEVGRGLKDGLAELQRLRNGTVRGLGYPDFFSYMVSEYGMTTEEMLALNERFLRELRPLYRELHTYWRHELARRYGAPVPELIPAHWLPNRWSQDWSALLEVPGVDLDAALASRPPEWLVEQAERFYISLGFPELPQSFWEKSSLYPLPPGAAWKKNNHASAWHVDLDRDVRSLMSVVSNSEWYETTHHELGHIYYYVCYSNADVPHVLRTGANRAFHEAVGSMMGLAAMQPRFVAAVGLSAGAPPQGAGGARPDPIQLLHKEALNYVVFMPWSSGVMTHFEQELYGQELPMERWNRRWWEMVAKYQGVAPPTPRGEEYCDAATKTHVNDDPAGYYDYALSFAILFQLHEHVARNLLREDPHDTNYFGRRDVGDFLRSLLTPGASVDWRRLMREKLGQEISAEPMLRYFEPLQEWLREQNRGREHALPEV
jgi:peptidyl-dipeptidase A